MSDAFYGEIRMFAGSYAPRNWAFCNGQVLAVNEHPDLFSLVGTTYGGDGRQSFGLPEMRGRIPVHQGQGPGLTSRILGQRYGVETVQLTTDQIPAHHHPIQASTREATNSVPSNDIILAAAVSPNEIYGSTIESSNINALHDTAVNQVGGNVPHVNMMPTLCLNFIICITGVYPSRN